MARIHPNMSPTNPDIDSNRLQRMCVEIRDLSRNIPDLERTIDHMRSNMPHGFLDHGNLYQDLAEHVTAIVGFKEAVFSRSRPLKVFWSILVIVGVAATIFFIYVTTNQYLEYATATKIQFETNASYEHPPILVCPHVWIDEEKLPTMNLSTDAVRYSLGYFDHYHTYEVANWTEAREEFLIFYDRLNFSSLPDYFTSLAIDLVEARTVAEFANETKPAFYCNGCDRDKPMEKIFLDGVGVCYRFFLAGVVGGMSRWYWNDIFVKTKNSTGDEIYSDSWTAWYLYYSHEQEMESFTSAFMFLKPSVYTFVKVSAKSYVTLKKRDVLNCMPDDSIDGSPPYSARSCFVRCENALHFERIGCKMWTVRSIHDGGTDSPPTDYCNYRAPHDDDGSKNETWSDFIYGEALNDFHASVAARCSDRCPHKCRRIYFDIHTLTQYDFADADYEHVADRLLNQNMSVVALNVAHSAVHEGGILTVVEVHTYSFVEFVNNVGGTLGLFIGATLMSICQLGMCLIDRIVRRMSRANATVVQE